MREVNARKRERRFCDRVAVRTPRVRNLPFRGALRAGFFVAKSGTHRVHIPHEWPLMHRA